LGGVAAAAEAALFRNFTLIPIGVVASLGALIGDLLGAFLKRRLNVTPGDSLLPVDQLDFILAALLLTSPFLELTLGAVLILVIATVPIHLLANAVAYVLGLKSRVW